MFVVRGTKKFLDRAWRVEDSEATVEQPTNLLGDWYANVLFWRPQVALFVNEMTLLPVFVPFAPATSVVKRFRETLARMMAAYGLEDWFARVELPQMDRHVLEKTQSRSLLASMNDFVRQCEVQRHLIHTADDLVNLSPFLAETPCGPLFGSAGTPDREIQLIASRHPA